LASVLGFTFNKPELSEDEINNALNKVSDKLGKTFSTMDDLIKYRKEARESKNWDVADTIRITLDECGIVLKDTKDGTAVEAK
jgi:cysteinyl-tRNA synthetase